MKDALIELGQSLRTGGQHPPASPILSDVTAKDVGVMDQALRLGLMRFRFSSSAVCTCPSIL